MSQTFFPANSTECNDLYSLRRPSNGFGQFVRLQTKNIAGSPISRMKMLGEMWRNSSGGVKQKCVARARREMNVYKARKSELLKKKTKKPLSGYQLFLKQYLTNNKSPFKDHKSLFSEAAEFWRTLSPMDKIKWSERSRSDTKHSSDKMVRKSVSGLKKRKADTIGGKRKRASANNRKKSLAVHHKGVRKCKARHRKTGAFTRPGIQKRQK